MSPPLVTLVTACLCALLQFVLAVLVIRRRRQLGAPFAHGGDNTLLRHIRAHGNLAENAPTVLLLMLLCELLGLGRGLLLAAGGLFFAGRVLHALGLSKPQWHAGRVLGMAITLVVMSGLATAGLWLAASRWV
jgi:uncharacterized protein